MNPSSASSRSVGVRSSIHRMSVRSVPSSANAGSASGDSDGRSFESMGQRLCSSRNAVFFAALVTMGQEANEFRQIDTTGLAPISEGRGGIDLWHHHATGAL